MTDTSPNNKTKSMKRVVILPDNLYLKDIVFDDNDNLVHGFVINGHWYYNYDPETKLITCKDSDSKQARTKNIYTESDNTRIINIPSEMWNLHYNDVIDCAIDMDREDL